MRSFIVSVALFALAATTSSTFAVPDTGFAVAQQTAPEAPADVPPTREETGAPEDERYPEDAEDYPTDDSEPADEPESSPEDVSVSQFGPWGGRRRFWNGRRWGWGGSRWGGKKSFSSLKNKKIIVNRGPMIGSFAKYGWGGPWA